MTSQQQQADLIREHCGSWNSDIAAGWEAGLLGKERIGRRLYSRNAPDHLYKPENQQRLLDWLRGRDRAMEYRDRESSKRTMLFSGRTASGKFVHIHRKGWGAARGPIVSRMAQMGCVGDIDVDYHEREGAKSTIKRTVKCGI